MMMGILEGHGGYNAGNDFSKLSKLLRQTKYYSIGLIWERYPNKVDDCLRPCCEICTDV